MVASLIYDKMQNSFDMPAAAAMSMLFLVLSLAPLGAIAAVAGCGGAGGAGVTPEVGTEDLALAGGAVPKRTAPYEGRAAAVWVRWVWGGGPGGGLGGAGMFLAAASGGHRLLCVQSQRADYVSAAGADAAVVRELLRDGASFAGALCRNSFTDRGDRDAADAWRWRCRRRWRWCGGTFRGRGLVERAGAVAAGDPGGGERGGVPEPVFTALGFVGGFWRIVVAMVVFHACRSRSGRWRRRCMGWTRRWRRRRGTWGGGLGTRSWWVTLPQLAAGAAGGGAVRVRGGDR